MTIGSVIDVRNATDLGRDTFSAIDPALFASKSGFTLKVGDAVKHPQNPLLPRNAPWDKDSNDHYFGQIVRDARNGLYHHWHTAAGIGREGLVRNLTCYAYSRDGLRWARPSLGRIEFEGSRENNIWTTADYVDHHGIAGFFDDPNESDPRQRYKRPYPKYGVLTLNESHKPRGLHVATSPDLVEWTDTPESPVHLRRGIADTFNHGFWDDDRKEYIIITRTHRPVRGQGARCVGRLASPDFHHWGPLETVFTELEPGPDFRQYYAMPTFKYAGGYVGLIYVFHSKPIPENDDDSVMDCELAWSPDSIQWQEVCRGRPLIPRGEKGAFDHGRIFGLWAPIDLPHELRVYYGGVSLGKHRTYTLHEPVTCGMGLATFRKDGLAFLDAGVKATAVTRLVQLKGRFLVLNAEAAKGHIRVGLQDVLGSPVNGFSVDDCDPMTCDSISHVLSWRGNSDLIALSGRRVRLVIEAEKARFYAFRMV